MDLVVGKQTRQSLKRTFVGDEFASTTNSRGGEAKRKRRIKQQGQGDEGPILNARGSCNWPECKNSRRVAPGNQRRVCLQHEGTLSLLFSPSRGH